jgi:PAS domain S-box-containing protein
MPVQLDRRGDGTLEDAFFNCVYQPFHNSQGEVEGVLIHGVEVTHEVHARHHVEELVRQLEAEKAALWKTEREAAQHASHLTAVFEAITDGVMVCDTRGHTLQSNSAFRSILGLDEGDETALTLIEERRKGFIPRDLEGKPLPKERWPLMRALREESVSGTDTVDLLYCTPAGQNLYLNASAAPIYDPIGKIAGAVLVLRDVTERRQLEQQRQLSERKYRSLLDSNIVGVMVVGPNGGIYEVNDCQAKMFGYSKEELLSEDFSWYQFNPPEFRLEQDPITQTMAATGVIHLVEKELVRKDGSYFPVLLAGTIYDQEQQRAVMMFLDISDRKEAERRKQEFLGMVSHELRSPLTAILGFTELAQFYLQQFPRNSPSEKDTILNKVETILARTNQQVNIECRLVESLLDVARMEMHKFELSLQERNLVSVVREMAAYQQQIMHNRKIELLVPAQEQIPVRIDEDRIGQVLTNYLTNALRYSPANKAIVVGLTVEGKSARVFVRDQGLGLTPEQQQNIWERFYQTEPATHRGSEGGLGLGLYIAKIIIQQHGGQVGVESEIGQGSTFWFTLPLIDEPAQD